MRVLRSFAIPFNWTQRGSSKYVIFLNRVILIWGLLEVKPVRTSLYQIRSVRFGYELSNKNNIQNNIIRWTSWWKYHMRLGHFCTSNTPHCLIYSLLTQAPSEVCFIFHILFLTSVVQCDWKTIFSVMFELYAVKLYVITFIITFAYRKFARRLLIYNVFLSIISYALLIWKPENKDYNLNVCLYWNASIFFV